MSNTDYVIQNKDGQCLFKSDNWESDARVYKKDCNPDPDDERQYWKITKENPLRLAYDEPWAGENGPNNLIWTQQGNKKGCLTVEHIRHKNWYDEMMGIWDGDYKNHGLVTISECKQLDTRDDKLKNLWRIKKMGKADDFYSLFSPRNYEGLYLDHGKGGGEVWAYKNTGHMHLENRGWRIITKQEFTDSQPLAPPSLLRSLPPTWLPALPVHYLA